TLYLFCDKRLCIFTIICPDGFKGKRSYYQAETGCPEANSHGLGISTMKPKYPQYALPSKRQESFTEASIPWPQDAPVGVEKLVEAGLVYTGVGDNVRCYHCGGGLRSWKDGDDPMEEHAKWYPTCQHVLIVKGKTYIRKVEAGKKPKADSVDERMASKESVVTTKQKQDVQKPTPMGLGISTMKPKYPQYALPSKRQESFTEASIPWPQDAPVGVEKLVEAGLMYTGEGDSVRCYHCGGGLRNWEEGDDPMEEHAKLYPTCQHVLITKSKRYIRKVEAGGVVERVRFIMRTTQILPAKNEDQQIAHITMMRWLIDPQSSKCRKQCILLPK
ncbi:BIR1E-like protein, partial [Mya arenaria]